MKKFTLPVLVSFFSVLIALVGNAQVQEGALPAPQGSGQKGAADGPKHRCTTMELLERTLRENPGIQEEWKKEGEKRYQEYLQRTQNGNGTQRQERTMIDPIIVPIVFHLVDVATSLAWITDRDVYEQVESLNRDYAGLKMDEYLNVIPPEIIARVGHIPVKFVLARRTPGGALTSGIERRVGATPSHVNIKSTAAGGLDAWDVNKYVNVWAGTFSGGDAGLLGIATFPFTGASEGPQGVVIGLGTISFASPTARSYYPTYSEGATLPHEIGHYMYLWHTFGDLTTCNNQDFRIQAGWDLPNGGPAFDDTPAERAGPGNAYFGNPSMNHNDGCAVEPFGIMYGSYMNYFDDRALFMFSDGMRRRVEDCINLFRPGLLTSDGATAPSAVTDAHLVRVSSWGTPERRNFQVNNSPLQARVRNSGTTTLTAVTLNVSFDGGAPVATNFPINVLPGKDTLLNLANVSGAAGNHSLTVFTTSPNGGTDNFLNNDTIFSFINIHTTTAPLPFSESFNSTTFPPAGWQIWNANNPTTSTWTRDATSGATAAGAAYFNDYNINQGGTLDDLITPGLDLGTSTAATLKFKVAYASYDEVDVSTWDGLEVYVSGDGGFTYKLAYKKTGNALRTVTGSVQTAFAAPPTSPASWREETVNLTPYMVAGQKMIVKFRNVNAFGNNLFLDDINISAPTVGADARITVISSPANASSLACIPITPVVTLNNNGTTTLTSVPIGVALTAGGGTVTGSLPYTWTGTLAPGASTTVTLTGITVNPAIGSNTLKIYSILPGDVIPANDTATSIFTRVSGVAVPVVEGFEGATYPSAGWSLTPAAGNTWQKVNYANNGGANSIKADFWNFGTGTQFSLGTPEINVAGEPIIKLKFDISHKLFGTSQDRLEVLVTNNCGTSFTTVYNKTSSSTSIPAPPALATTTAGGALADGGFAPNAADQWRTESLDLTGPILSAGHIQIFFRATSNFGNNLYVDNINIDKVYQRDLTVLSVARPGIAECGPFSPVATIKNVGIETITSYAVTYRIDGGPLQTTTVSTALAPDATANITLTPAASPTNGTHTITICSANPTAPSGTGDLNTLNDCRTISFIQRVLVSTPVVEGFEATTFPSPGWSIINPNNNNTWVRRTPGFGSTNSAFINNYDDYTGQVDFIQSPAFSLLGAGGAIADSVIVTWDLAHQNYPDPTLADELSVRTSSDCGNTFTNVIFARAGAALAGPAGSNAAAYTNPAPNHWQHLRAAAGGSAVGQPLANGNLMVTVRNLAGFGNNIFVDNINIQVLFKRDLKLVSIDKPALIECTGGFTPQATVLNNGLETISAFTISYAVDGGATQNTNVTGLSLARNASMSVNLTPAVAGLAPGQHSIRVFSANPVTPSGTGDQFTLNDTLTKAFGVTATVAAPLVEGFESATFPPNGWAVSNPDGRITWSKATTGSSSNGSATIRNFSDPLQNSYDDLFSPNITYNGVDSVRLSFDLSALTYDYPGATALETDTLEVLVTKNCGNTYTSVWKKWGHELQTINDPNYPQTIEFVPSSSDQWRSEVIDLTQQFAPNGPVQVVFRNTNKTLSFQNNLYVDNVNLSTRTLPAFLKTNGYLILPNPFTDAFTIWHLVTPENLRYVSVYNSTGQLVWKKEFHGDAAKQTLVDLTGKAAGTYIVNMGYNDRQKNVQVKVIKQ